MQLNKNIYLFIFFFFQAEDGIRDYKVTGVQTCALPIFRAQKLKSGFSLLGVFIGVASLIGAWSIVNGVNRYMTEKFAQTLYGVNTFQLRRRPMFAANVPDSVWRAWRRRPRIKFSDAEAVTAALTMPVVTAWQS